MAEPNVKIYVEDINPDGDKTILFLHGWPGDHTLFEYQFNELPKRGYRCIGIDTRGFGMSDKPWHGYDYNRLADDVKAVVDVLKLRDFGNRFFFQHTSEAFSDWFFQIGLKAASWATAAVANTWLKEVLFSDLEKIEVPTLIIQGIHDKIVPYCLSEAQNKAIKNSRLVQFKYSGHGTFYDEKDNFNKVLMEFVEE